jgi:hypothetical protein
MSLLNLQSPAGQSPRGKKSLKMWMGAGLVVAVLGIGSTFAANININSGEDGTEFGQGVTRTVFCGAGDDEEEATITVTPLSKFVNSESYMRLVRAATQAIPENSFTARFATSVYSGSQNFITSAQATKIVNGRTGVWLTKKGTDSNVAVATNQDETTFTTQQKNDYVFSMLPATGNNNARGFYKVNDTREEKIVITAAVAARSGEYEEDETEPDFYFSGVVISEIPTKCRGKNFIVSGYDDESSDPRTIIDLDGSNDVTEVTALFTGTNVTPLVSRNRNYFDNIDSRVTASQGGARLELIFGRGDSATYLPTDELVRLVIETQENTLFS